MNHLRNCHLFFIILNCSMSMKRKTVEGHPGNRNPGYHGKIQRALANGVCSSSSSSTASVKVEPSSAASPSTSPTSAGNKRHKYYDIWMDRTDLMRQRAFPVKTLTGIYCRMGTIVNHKAWPGSEDMESYSGACWWCSEPWKGPMFFAPTDWDDRAGSVTLEGRFCSENCARAYIESNFASHVAPVKCGLLLRLHNQMYHRDPSDMVLVGDTPRKPISECHMYRGSSCTIQPALHWSCLKKFGGPMTIEEFRATNRNHIRTYVWPSRLKKIPAQFLLFTEDISRPLQRFAVSKHTQILNTTTADDTKRSCHPTSTSSTSPNSHNDRPGHATNPPKTTKSTSSASCYPSSCSSSVSAVCPATMTASVSTSVSTSARLPVSGSASASTSVCTESTSPSIEFNFFTNKPKSAKAKHKQQQQIVSQIMNNNNRVVSPYNPKFIVSKFQQNIGLVVSSQPLSQSISAAPSASTSKSIINKL